MDIERRHFETRKTEKLTPEQERILQEIEELTRLRADEADEVHGIKHQEMVVWIVKYLAGQESVDVFCVTVAAWLHDWGRVKEQEREKGGDRQPHAMVSVSKSQRLILKPLLEEGKIAEGDYQRILGIIEAHSKLPEGKMREKKVLRDADRLSRFSAVGLYQVMSAAIGAKRLPFYTSGQPIIRPRQAMLLKEVKCVIDDINLCGNGSYCFLETKAGRQLVDEFELLGIYDEFLRTFSKYKDTVNEATFFKWVASVARDNQIKLDKLKQAYAAEKREIKIEDILAIESPGVFNEENFLRFLKDEDSKIKK